MNLIQPFELSDPPERLTIEGPDDLTPDHEARLTCKASDYNLPSQLTIKLTSHHTDLLEELTKEGSIEVEPLKEKWSENSDKSGWKTSRSVVLKPQLLERATELGNQLTFECQVPDPYDERRILTTAAKFVALISKNWLFCCFPIPIQVFAFVLTTKNFCFRSSKTNSSRSQTQSQWPIANSVQ